VKYLTLQRISGAQEYQPICPAYIWATERYHWGWKEHRQRWKGGWGASGGWWGGPQSRKYQFRVECCPQHNQQWIWTHVSWWGSHTAECASNWPINRWPGSRPEVFNFRPGWNQVSGAPGLGHMVHCEEVGLGFWYARSAGSGWNGPWQDFHLGGSSNHMQTAHCESGNGVTAVEFVGEYPQRVGEFDTNDCPGIVGEEWERYPFQTQNKVPCCIMEIQKIHLSVTQRLHQPSEQSWWWQCLELQGHSRVSLTRWHIELISNLLPCCTQKMRISPTRNWTPVLMCLKTDGISTLFHMIP